MIRKLAATLFFLFFATNVAIAQQANEKQWAKEVTTTTSAKQSEALKILSRRLDFGDSIQSTAESWKFDGEVPYDQNIGTSGEPVWSSVYLPGGKILFHDREGKEFTAIFAWKEEFVSRCRFPGKAFGITFVQVVSGHWKKRGYEISHVTVPLQGAREFGDMRFEDVERFNTFVVYNRYRAGIESTPALKFVAEVIQKYERHKGADAWKEKSVGGEAQMTKCDLPIASKTNQ